MRFLFGLFDRNRSSCDSISNDDSFEQNTHSSNIDNNLTEEKNVNDKDLDDEGQGLVSSFAPYSDPEIKDYVKEKNKEAKKYIKKIENTNERIDIMNHELSSLFEGNKIDKEKREKSLKRRICSAESQVDFNQKKLSIINEDIHKAEKILSLREKEKLFENNPIIEDEIKKKQISDYINGTNYRSKDKVFTIDALTSDLKQGKWYVYAHFLPNSRKPFYIGKGTGSRAVMLTSRHFEWSKYVNDCGYACNDVRVKLACFFDSEREALTYEESLIKEYKDKTNLVNIDFNR